MKHLFTTTATVAYGNNIAAPCPDCGTLVLIRIENPAAGRNGEAAEIQEPVTLSAGVGKCRGCGHELPAKDVRIPRGCWQPNVHPEPSHVYAEIRRDCISAAHGSNTKGVNHV